ncbi:DUF1800 family protein [Roseibacillus persicicus]|uniref:DUF1800 family protein n=1 Tax=Roseibacillus persicicus TaxID=454148 RepID=UPI00398A73A1
MKTRFNFRHLGLPAGILLVTSLNTSAVDLDGDGLSDLWELNFGAEDEPANGDPDGDGYSNVEESLAGTDPFSATSFPDLGPFRIAPGGSPLSFDFPTEAGKFYQLTESEDLLSFRPFGPAIAGDGGAQSVTLQSLAPSTSSGRVLQSFWSNLSGTELSALTDLPTFPEQPDGHNERSTFETQAVKGSGFGVRLQALVTPPETGNYTFSLSAGSPAKAYLSSGTDSNQFADLAEVFPAQDDILPDQWDRYSSQRSAPVLLTAGESYLVEIHHLSLAPEDHCQLAWTGPGITDTAVITSDYLAALPLLPTPNSREDLILHDYDTQTGPLWPANTSIVPAPAGMEGNAEQILDDPGNLAAESILFPQPVTDHFYATWLFRMGTGHDDVHLFFQGPDTSQEGPRVNMEERNDFTTVAVRAGGSYGVRQIEVDFDTTYRVELVASLETPFTYQQGLSTRTVAPDTFDIFVTTTTGKLVGSELGLTFRDEGENVITSLDRMRAVGVSTPNIVVDSWEITDGKIAGNGILRSNISDFTLAAERQFFQLQINDRDQDADGLSDWEEQLLAQHQPFLFFDTETTAGVSDSAAMSSLLSNNTGTPVISLAASDTTAFEDNSPNTSEDHGSILLTRTGTLAPVTIQLCVAPLENTGGTATVCDGTCCSLVGSAGDEEAEVEDYRLLDAEGNLVTDTVTFALGEMSKTLTVVATPDSLNEYPETLNLAVAPSEDASYEISETLNGASIQLFDLADNPANNAIFTGSFSQDGNAVVATQGSGFTTAILNGPRTKLFLTNEFSNLTSVQQDSHVHKSNSGPAPGDIIYSITNEPGGESLPAPASDPYLGFLTAYEWDLTESSGAVPTSGGAASKQVIIDSLFAQNGESPLYLNIHTVDNPAGEIWAFLNLTGGSISDPGAPAAAALAGSPEYPQLFGEELEAEVRRFLNQATFGATDAQVADLVAIIETARLTDESYHRASAYEAWIDNQMSLQQTYLLDYHLATDFQFMALNGAFDPARNPPVEAHPTPSRPASWPTVDRSNPDPEKWHLSGPYPLTRDDVRLAEANELRVEPNNRERRHAHWQMMLNARDQLRQKTGFALQQIVVVSAELTAIRNSPYAASNYQDQLNTRAFGPYRDVLGYVNWSPIMGKWLSSLGNQKGLDIDGDGTDDISPDENLARENMQLFSIGLFNLWPDGTLRLGPDGAPNNTYNNDDIREFAKVLTGQSFSVDNDREVPWGGLPFESLEENTNFTRNQNQAGLFEIKYNYPMKMFGDYHDRSVKSFAGVTIDNTDLTDPTEQGIADIEDALNWLAGTPGDGNPDFDMVHSHGSTPAFISLRLIQRFTTSNPSRDYLHRVATAFQEEEGDLAATVKAILLDPEARQLDPTNTTFGLKRSPLESYLQLARSLEVVSYLPLVDPANEYPFDTAPGNFNNSDLFLDNFGLSTGQLANQERNHRFLQNNTITSGTTGLQMVPFRQETVFNWYLPDYAPSGPIADAGLVAPELQLANEPDVIRNINYLQYLLRGSNGLYVDSLGGSSATQQYALGSDETVNNNDNIRLDRDKWVALLYPASEPLATDTRSSESLADEQLVDELDRRLTYGFLKAKYPYDPSDDDDPNSAGEDDFLKNPRELIIDAITDGHGNPYSGNNDENDKRGKLIDALYLLSVSPEFQIKK